ncbi:MAG: hypothetical protein EOO81_12240 [Oxalobacteraceae bacterium]|nr:MAG: hypothetical protein EOO81_12240 [Oxalobacteraceae bacterium]
MTPSVLRQSGPKHIRDGQMFTPRAVIHFCETCGFEGAPYGDTDAQGKRIYFCREHNPAFRIAKGERE